jgi:APA family basic amino acid/polyamine antiporter
VAPQSIVAAAAIAAALLVGATIIRPDDEVSSLASLFSFGILLAFTAAQFAVIVLRFTQPSLRRPFRVPLNVRIGDRELPLPSVVGLLLTLTIWIVAMATHPGARYAGPAWLAVGLAVFAGVRLGRGERFLGQVVSSDERQLGGARYHRILVPMKIGPIGEEMVATAVKLAQDGTTEGGASIEALFVMRVPLDQPLDAAMPELERRAAESLAEAQGLAADYGVEVNGVIVRARSIGPAIVAEAKSRDADLIVLGSAPRWRRQSRFFSPTVDHVLRRALCEVLIVAFPQGVLEEEGVSATLTL